MPRLRFPDVYVCPRTPGKRSFLVVFKPASTDAFNETKLKHDIALRLPVRNASTYRDLLTYATVSAGFHVGKEALCNKSPAELHGLKRMFDIWRDERDLTSFYDTLFNQYGYTCDEVSLFLGSIKRTSALQMFQRCKYADTIMPCCDVFRPTNVMLRGRCFRLRPFHQDRPDWYGTFKLTLKQLPSHLHDSSQVSVVS